MFLCRLRNYLQVVLVVGLLGKFDKLSMAHGLICYRLLKEQVPRILLLLFPEVIFLDCLDVDADGAVRGSGLTA